MNKIFPSLRHWADLRTLLFLALMLFLLALHYSGIIHTPWIYLATCPLSFVCCIIAHNHMHTGTFQQSHWNHAFQILLTLGIGQPPTGIITAHNERHHGDFESDRDFVNTSLASSRSNVVNILLFPFRSVKKMYREKPSDLKRWKTQRPKLYRQAVLERTAFYLTLATLLIFDWEQTLLTFLVPWIFGQYCLIAINLLQHQDCEHDSKWNHSRNLTGSISNWFLFNNGYHTAHHLKPGLHWSLLAEYHRNHVQTHMNPSLNHRSLVHLIWCRIASSKHHA